MRTASRGSTNPSRIRCTVAAGVLILAAFLAYLPALSGDFQWDDHSNIRENFALRRDAATAAAFWPSRALTLLSFWLNYRLGGLAVFGYHLANVLIHCLGAFGIYLILDLVLPPNCRKNGAALLGALLFALHPLQTQAVAYITQRYASLSGTLAVWSVFFYLLRPRKTGSLIASAACLLGAIGARESAAAVPWALAAIALFRRDAAGLRRAVPLLLVSLLVLPPILLTARGTGGMDAYYYRAGVGGMPEYSFGAQAVTLSGRGQYLLTQLGAFRLYLRLLLLPLGLAPYHDLTPPNSLGTLDLCTLAGIVFCVLFGAANLRRGGLVGGGLIWFLVCLLPTSSLVVLWPFAAEHHLYLPLGGLTLAFSANLTSPGRSRAAAAIVIFLGCLTFIRAQAWTTEVLLWQDNVDNYPDFALARYSLAGALIKNGMLEDGLREAEAAARLNPRLNTWPNRWAALYGLRYWEEAEEAARIWRAGRPGEGSAHLALGKTLLASGRAQDAVEILEQAHRSFPGNSEPLLLLGLAWKQLGNLEQEEFYLLAAWRLDPTREGPLISLGSLRARQGRLIQAEELYARAVRLNPASPTAWYNQGNFLLACGRKQEGREALNRARNLAAGTVWAQRLAGAAREEMSTGNPVRLTPPPPAR